MEIIDGLPVLTTGTDNEGDDFAVDQLMIFRDQINSGFVPYWPNHQSVGLPMGRLTNARIQDGNSDCGTLLADLLLYDRSRYPRLEQILDRSIDPSVLPRTDLDWNAVDVCVSSNGAEQIVKETASQLGQAVRCHTGRELLKSDEGHIVLVVGISATAVGMASAFLSEFAKRLGQRAADGFADAVHKASDVLLAAVAPKHNSLIDELVFRVNVGPQTIVDYSLPTGLGDEATKAAVVRMQRIALDPLSVLRPSVRPSILRIVFEWHKEPDLGWGWFVSYVLTDEDRVYIDKSIQLEAIPLVRGGEVAVSVGISSSPAPDSQSGGTDSQCGAPESTPLRPRKSLPVLIDLGGQIILRFLRLFLVPMEWWIFFMRSLRPGGTGRGGHHKDDPS
jgi:hypothetical protein